MTTAATPSKPPLLPPQPPPLSAPSPAQPPSMQLLQTQQRQLLPPPPQQEQLPPQQARLAQPAPSASRPEPLRRPQAPPLTPSTPRHPRSPLHHGHLLAPVQPIAPSPNAAASPPSKRDLKSWWKSFKPQSKSQEAPDQRPRGIFGVPLRESIIYANVAISLVDEHGKSYIYGYVPIVVAKCGVFLKEKATNIEGIFRLSGSEKRIKELKSAFDSPDRYGKGLSWNGYTVHDAANVLRRYLNDLPEPVVPLSFYARFREPLRGAVRQPVADADGPQFVEGFDMGAAIVRYQQLITELPPLHRQLLLYILDLLAVFAAKSDVNRMNSQNLAAIFQPGILSHPYHAMAPEEYRLNQTVLIFLIENQDHFLIGMQGTAADAETVQEVQRGTPPVTPSFAFDSTNAGGLTHRTSNASAGAESVARDGKIRRNHSTSSRKSRHSNSNSISNNAHASTPRSSSPALVSTPTSASGGGGGLSRSNTVPSRSPGLTPGRFNKRSDVAASPVSPLTPLAHHSPLHTAPSVEPVKEVVTPSDDISSQDPFTTIYPAADATIPAAASTPTQPRTPTFGSLPPLAGTAPSTPIAKDSGTSTPSKEKRFQIFQRSPTSDGEMRPQPNKLRKRRIPSSANASAQSSTASLPPSSSILASPSRDYVANPFDDRATSSLAALGALSAPPSSSSLRQTSNADAASENGFDFTPRVSQVPSTATMTATTAALSPTLAPTTAATATAAAAGSSTSEGQLRPHRKSPSTSLHSSFNEGSDIDQVDEVPSEIVQEQTEQSDKAKKRLWRLSRRRDESLSTIAPGLSTGNLSSTSTPPQQAASLGSNMNAEASTSSIGSGGGPVPVPMGALFTAGANGYSDPTLTTAEAQMSQDSGTTTGSSRDGREDNGKGKLSGWLKSKYREAKGSADHRRNKSPPPANQPNQFMPLAATRRGKSLDLSRATGEGKSPI